MKKEITLYELVELYFASKLKIIIKEKNEENLDLIEDIYDDFYFLPSEILKIEDKYYHYNFLVSNGIVIETEEETKNIKLVLTELKNITKYGKDFYLVNIKGKKNLLNNITGKCYFSNPVDEIKLFFKNSYESESWENLETILILVNKKIRVFKNNNRDLIEINCNVDKNKYIDSISSNGETIIYKNLDKYELYYKGELKVTFGEYLKVNNYFFLSNINKKEKGKKIYDLKGKKACEGYSILDDFKFTSKKLLKYMILENRVTHKKYIFEIKNNFEEIIPISKEYTYLSGDFFYKKLENSRIEIVDKYGQREEFDNAGIPKLIKEKLVGSKQRKKEVTLIEIPIKLMRGKLYQTDNLNSRKIEYSKIYLFHSANGDIRWFKIPELAEAFFDINKLSEDIDSKIKEKEENKRKKFKIQILEKIFIERLENGGVSDDVIFIIIVYKIIANVPQTSRKNKRETIYITKRFKYFDNGVNQLYVNLKYELYNESFNIIYDRNDIELIKSDTSKKTYTSEQKEFYSHFFGIENIDNILEYSINKVPDEVIDFIEKKLKNK